MARHKNKRTKKAKSKKHAKPKITRNFTSVAIGQGFPKRMTTTLKYVENFVMTSNSSVPATYLFSCNGCYDPNITATGHQPMYFDQFMDIYNHYTVIGSKARIVMSAQSLAQAGVVGCYVNDDTTVSPTILSTFEEQSIAKWRVLNYGLDKPIIFNMKWSAKKFFAGSILANDNLEGSLTSNPVEQSFYTLFWRDNGYPVSSGLNITVEIDYIVVFHELKDIAGS